jgi:hypothetical protein
MPDVLAQADVFGIAKELFIAVPAAGACVIMVILFLKFLRELSADHKDTSKKFADTLEKLNEDSNRRAKECHEAHATRYCFVSFGFPGLHVFKRGKSPYQGICRCWVS